MGTDERKTEIDRAEFPQPDWDYWRHIPNPKLWELVTLSCDVEPREQIPPDEWESNLKTDLPRFSDRYGIALANRDKFDPVSVSTKPGEWEIPMGQFLTLAIRSEWDIPPDLAKMEPAELAGRREAENAKAPTMKVGARKYEPHISPMLAAMYEAADKFWGNVNRDERDTYPKNEKVASWLRQRVPESQGGFSADLANKAASIIRPTWAGRGGRPPKVE